MRKPHQPQGQIPAVIASFQPPRVGRTTLRPSNPPRPEPSAGEAALRGGELMRGGDAQHRRAARRTPPAVFHRARGPRPRAFSAKRRTSQPRESAAFARALVAPVEVSALAPEAVFVSRSGDVVG